MTAPTPNNMPTQVPAAAAAAAPATAEPAAAATSPAAAPATPAPPWGDDANFDPAKAWNLIQNLRSENKQLTTKVSEAKPILDAHAQSVRDEQGELETARQDLATQATRSETWRNQAVQAKVEALAAASKFVDPADAVTMIGDLTQYVTDDDGIDADKLAARIEQLVKDKPYLVATEPKRGFTPNRAQGQAGNGPLTAAQVAAVAESQGDSKTALRAKTEQLVTLRAAGA
ncbi:hypothetical protein [Mycolicibacterium mucogenicum]|uniref:Scaffolding protein n=1 Tax=Mycolicibacterium mucogenicum DSM 44124 TaxID=1226753 RepID=A0A8H2JIA9_MYCMU|nr:hypothetical protein [Mycolicibacterium mucogenicum]KAB7752884.1 hypothetical protein MMUC44124_26495 [Mycolicibacterium mucogenicum DSM 44124]QPG69093.1 hypothetical protein C1S78_027520 [Mycolicibacterium mucogenicum DSM 44124]